MKKRSLLLMLLACASELTLPKYMFAQLPPQVVHQSNKIEDVLASAHNRTERVAILASILDDGMSSNSERTAAARALAIAEDNEGINSLIDRVDMLIPTPDGQKFAAIDALRLSGERAIPQLLLFLGKSQNEVKRQFAVETIVKIKGRQFNQFLEANTASLAPNVVQALRRYAVQD